MRMALARRMKIEKCSGNVTSFQFLSQSEPLSRLSWNVLCFRSGKTARKTIADLADGKSVKIPPTIEDPSVYKGLKEALQNIGYAIEAPDPVL